MKIEYDKIEFDMNEFAPLLLQDKQEGFRRIGEMFLNIALALYDGTSSINYNTLIKTNNIHI